MENPIVQYKEYIIRPTPMELADDGRWNHEVYICLDSGDQYIEKKFSSATTFETRDEAITHCLFFAKQIIDGELPDLSLDDL